jgi:hypothetical protein
MTSKVWSELSLQVSLCIPHNLLFIAHSFRATLFGVLSPSVLTSTRNHSSFLWSFLSSNIPAHLCPFHVFKQMWPMRSLHLLGRSSYQSRSLHCPCTLQDRAHHSIHRKLRTRVKGRGKGEARVYCQTGDFLPVAECGRHGESEETQFSCGLTIEPIVPIYGHV